MQTSKPKSDADIIHGIILALIEGAGRGGLTWASKRVGMDVPSFRRRIFKSKRPLDSITLLVYLLIKESKAKEGETLIDEKRVGGFIIGKRKDNSPAWRTP